MSHSNVKRKNKSLLFRISKWIHKYLGLTLALFLMWMSISGILLNHPHLISKLSVPKWAIPSHYIPENWNRSALTYIEYSHQNPELVFASGKSGVWRSKDHGKTFSPFMNGEYPSSEYYKKTNHIYLHESENESWLFAGNDYGLFYTSLTNGNWQSINLETHPIKVVKFIQDNDVLLVVTASDIYSISLPPNDISIVKYNIQQTQIEKETPLIDFFFDLHSGKIFGLPGQLIFDLAGIVLFYLSFTAFYTWIYTKKRRRDRESGTAISNPIGRRFFRFLLKYHLSLGIWFAVFLFIFGVTGFFMRPPFLAALVDKGIELPDFMNHRNEITWTGKIHNGTKIVKTDELLLDTSEGVWKGDKGINASYSKIQEEWPIFVMGATVLEQQESSAFIVGSFSGLFQISSHVTDLMTNNLLEDINAIKPGDFMVTGFFETPEKESFIFTHEQGILPLPGFSLKDRFQQPKSISNNYRMPLWNYLFEIHNGRFFKGIFGDLYILLLPLGSFLFVIISLTGIIDWFFHNGRKSNAL